MAQARVLVTGGAGFIGSNLVSGLLRSGYAVRVLDNFSTGNINNLAEVINEVELFRGDIEKEAIVNQALLGVDYVLHHAAIPSVPRSLQYPVATTQVNIVGLVNVLRVAKNYGIKKFIFASSSSVYGDAPLLPKEESLPVNPISPYAINKYAGELFCKNFCSLYGLPMVIFRYFNVFGPKQDPGSPYSAVIPLFIKALRNNEAPVIYGDGSQARDFCFVDNVVQANLLALQAATANGEVINIACGQKTSLNDLLKKLNTIFNKNITAQYLPARPGDVKDSLADISRAQRLLNYQPQVFIDEGLAKTVAWYLQH